MEEIHIEVVRGDSQVNKVCEEDNNWPSSPVVMLSSTTHQELVDALLKRYSKSQLSSSDDEVHANMDANNPSDKTVLIKVCDNNGAAPMVDLKKTPVVDESVVSIGGRKCLLTLKTNGARKPGQPRMHESCAENGVSNANVSAESRRLPEDRICVENAAEDNTDPDYPDEAQTLPRRRGRPPKYPGASSRAVISGVKRGRGRPRRYPRADDTLSTQRPALLLPDERGHIKLIIAPAQQNGTIDHLKKKLSTLPLLKPKPNDVLASLSQTQAFSNLLTPENAVILQKMLDGPSADNIQTLHSASSNLVPIEMSSTENSQVLTDNLHAVTMETEQNNTQENEKSVESFPACTENSILCMENSQTSVVERYDEQMQNTQNHEILIGEKNSLADCDMNLEVLSKPPLIGNLDETENQTVRLEDGGDKHMEHLGSSNAANSGTATILTFPAKVPVKIGIKSSQEDLERLRCPACGLQCYVLDQLQCHLTSDHPDDVIACTVCRAHVSLSPEQLLVHCKEKHTGNVCRVCDHVCRVPSQLPRHMMRHMDKAWHCALCNKYYKDAYVLAAHKKVVHDMPRVLYACDVCHKSFRRKAHLKRHAYIHAAVKPYKCPECNYTACAKADVRQHQLIHGEPRFQCPVCQKPFRHKWNIELHVKRKHLGERDYKCGVCNYYGFSFTEIRIHIERKHAALCASPQEPGQPLLPGHCSNCGREGTQSFLEAHEPNCDGILSARPDMAEIHVRAPDSTNDSASSLVEELDPTGVVYSDCDVGDGEVTAEQSSLPRYCGGLECDATTATVENRLEIVESCEEVSGGDRMIVVLSER